MRSSPFDKDKGNVCNCAVVHEILEGIRPEKHAESSQKLSEDSNCEEDGRSKEIQVNSIARSQGLIGGGGTCSRGSQRFPSDSIHKEHEDSQKPEEREGTVGVELGK